MTPIPVAPVSGHNLSNHISPQIFKRIIGILRRNARRNVSSHPVIARFGGMDR
jgi:hypothetical protein